MKRCVYTSYKIGNTIDGVCMTTMLPTHTRYEASLFLLLSVYNNNKTIVEKATHDTSSTYTPYIPVPIYIYRYIYAHKYAYAYANKRYFSTAIISPIIMIYIYTYTYQLLTSLHEPAKFLGRPIVTL
jgi:hypothetical protein